MTGKELTELVCANLKKARKEAGFTLSKAGKKLGVNYQQIYNFERGVTLPRPQNLCDLSEVYGIDVLDLFRKGEE